MHRDFASKLTVSSRFRVVSWSYCSCCALGFWHLWQTLDRGESHNCIGVIDSQPELLNDTKSCTSPLFVRYFDFGIDRHGEIDRVAAK
jgi:hypothetical protein